jgi:membrane protease YdiL (CAAX protease family)
VPLAAAVTLIDDIWDIYLARYALGAAFAQTAGAGVFHPAPQTVFILIFGQTTVALGEEPGWRGFALGQLTHRLGVIRGSVLLGVAWAVWLPLFLVEGTAQYGTSFFAFLTILVAWSLTVTYVVRRARGSAIAAKLFHASANLCDFTMPAMGEHT